MKSYFYDFHLHSNLSPCGEEEMTPNSIAGFAALSGLELVALTDHNTCKNCPAFFKAAKRYGILPIAGMELTTSEEVHMVCLFPHLENALLFEEQEVFPRRMNISNNPQIFGHQYILDENDEILSEDPYFLPAATALSVTDAEKLVRSYGGVSYPAHIDRTSGGILAILGDFPKELSFHAFELKDSRLLEEYRKKYPVLEKKLPIFSSDAHSLAQMKDAEHSLLLPSKLSEEELSEELISLLGGTKIEGTVS